MIDFYRRHMCLIWLSAGYVYAALMRDGDRPVPWFIRYPVLVAVLFLAMTADHANNDREKRQ